MGVCRITAAFLLSCQLGHASEIDAHFKKVRGKTAAARIESASLPFLGIPYRDGPTGDGPGDPIDPRPFYRLDAFDCTTFVETVLALATSSAARDFEKRLLAIRYHGDKPSFLERNHFPCVDWIPHNMRLGLLEDITAKLGKPVQMATAPIQRASWFAKLPPSVVQVPGLTDAQKQARLRQIQTQARTLPTESPQLPYIALTDILTRQEVSPEELARRQSEEESLAKMERETPRDPQSEEEDLEKKIHDQVIDKRLRYLIQDAQVDEAFLKSIPSGTLLNVVRPGWKIPGTALNISHQGFVIQKKQGTYFRHTSRTGGRAKDVLLANYLRLCLLLPPVKGINLQAVKLPTVASTH